MSNKTFTGCCLLLLMTLCAVVVISARTAPVVTQTNLEKLPMNISGYTATDDTFPDSVYRLLNADKHLYRHYRSPSGDQIDLYVGYYGTAKGGRTGHNPYACLPGSGAAIVETDFVQIKQTATGKNVQVNYILSRKDNSNTVMLHWYQTAGKTVVSSGIAQNIERFKGRILHNRNDGAFVRITADSAVGNLATTRQRVEQFAEIVMNLLPEYWPVENNN